MYLLIVMLAAGELSLKVVDTLEGHGDPIFVQQIDRFEEWVSMSGVLEQRAVEAVRHVIGEIEGKDVGYEVVVRYNPADRLRKPSSLTDLESNL